MSLVKWSPQSHTQSINPVAPPIQMLVLLMSVDDGENTRWICCISPAHHKMLLKMWLIVVSTAFRATYSPLLQAYKWQKHSLFWWCKNKRKCIFKTCSMVHWWLVTHSSSHTLLSQKCAYVSLMQEKLHMHSEMCSAELHLVCHHLKWHHEFAECPSPSVFMKFNQYDEVVLLWMKKNAMSYFCTAQRRHCVLKLNLWCNWCVLLCTLDTAVEMTFPKAHSTTVLDWVVWAEFGVAQLSIYRVSYSVLHHLKVLGKVNFTPNTSPLTTVTSTTRWHPYFSLGTVATRAQGQWQA